MAEQLFPVIETPEKIGVSSQYDQRYKRSYKWDFEMGDFARDGANRNVMGWRLIKPGARKL